MKKINIYLIISTLLVGLFSCRDEALNPIPSAKFTDGVTFTAVAKSSPFLDLGKLDGAKMEFETATARPDLISKIDVMAELIPAKGVKISKPLLTLSSVVGSTSILYTQFFTALGVTPAQLNPGDVIRAKFVAVTPDGRTFSEDNTVGTLPTAGNSGFTRSVNVTVACVFNSAQFAIGTWVINQDDWNDYKKGDEISVKPGPGVNDLTIGVFATDGAHKDIVITVTNANTGAVRVSKQAYGTYGKDSAIWSAEGAGSLSGCAGTINLDLTHTSIEYGVNAGFLLKLVRK